MDVTKMYKTMSTLMNSAKFRWLGSVKDSDPKLQELFDKMTNAYILFANLTSELDKVYSVSSPASELPWLTDTIKSKIKDTLAEKAISDLPWNA